MGESWIYAAYVYMFERYHKWYAINFGPNDRHLEVQWYTYLADDAYICYASANLWNEFTIPARVASVTEGFG